MGLLLYYIWVCSYIFVTAPTQRPLIFRLCFTLPPRLFLDLSIEACTRHTVNPCYKEVLLIKSTFCNPKFRLLFVLFLSGYNNVPLSLTKSLLIG